MSTRILLVYLSNKIDQLHESTADSESSEFVSATTPTVLVCTYFIDNTIETFAFFGFLSSSDAMWKKQSRSNAEKLLKNFNLIVRQ